MADILAIAVDSKACISSDATWCTEFKQHAMETVQVTRINTVIRATDKLRKVFRTLVFMFVLLRLNLLSVLGFFFSSDGLLLVLVVQFFKAFLEH